VGDLLQTRVERLDVGRRLGVDAAQERLAEVRQVGAGEAADEALEAGDADLDVPIYAVWGNHDWHCDDVDAIRPILQDAGITLLEREAATVCIGATEIGIVGLKGFVGGFPGSHLPDFGEPLLRRVYAETTQDVEALDHGLKAIAHCPLRIVLLHYAPTIETLRG